MFKVSYEEKTCSQNKKTQKIRFIDIKESEDEGWEAENKLWGSYLKNGENCRWTLTVNIQIPPILICLILSHLLFLHNITKIFYSLLWYVYWLKYQQEIDINIYKKVFLLNNKLKNPFKLSLYKINFKIHLKFK